jgi:hypothetical protein
MIDLKSTSLEYNSAALRLYQNFGGISGIKKSVTCHKHSVENISVCLHLER